MAKKKKLMDKVKIKRVKKNNKKITAKQKLLAGLGVGGALLGAAGATMPKPSSPIVSTNNGGLSNNKITDSLKNIFKSAYENTIGAPKAKADNSYANGVPGGYDPSDWEGITQGWGGGGGGEAGGGGDIYDLPTQNYTEPLYQSITDDTIGQGIDQYQQQTANQGGDNTNFNGTGTEDSALGGNSTGQTQLGTGDQTPPEPQTQDQTYQQSQATAQDTANAQAKADAEAQAAAVQVQQQAAAQAQAVIYQEAQAAAQQQAAADLATQQAAQQAALSSRTGAPVAVTTTGTNAQSDYANQGFSPYNTPAGGIVSGDVSGQTQTQGVNNATVSANPAVTNVQKQIVTTGADGLPLYNDGQGNLVSANNTIYVYNGSGQLVPVNDVQNLASLPTINNNANPADSIDLSQANSVGDKVDTNTPNPQGSTTGFGTGSTWNSVTEAIAGPGGVPGAIVSNDGTTINLPGGANYSIDDFTSGKSVPSDTAGGAGSVNLPGGQTYNFQPPVAPMPEIITPMVTVNEQVLPVQTTTYANPSLLDSSIGNNIDTNTPNPQGSTIGFGTDNTLGSATEAIVDPGTVPEAMGPPVAATPDVTFEQLVNLPTDQTSYSQKGINLLAQTEDNSPAGQVSPITEQTIPSAIPPVAETMPMSDTLSVPVAPVVPQMVVALSGIDLTSIAKAPTQDAAKNAQGPLWNSIDEWEKEANSNLESWKETQTDAHPDQADDINALYDSSAETISQTANGARADIANTYDSWTKSFITSNASYTAPTFVAPDNLGSFIDAINNATNIQDKDKAVENATAAVDAWKDSAHKSLFNWEYDQQGKLSTVPPALGEVYEGAFDSIDATSGNLGDKISSASDDWAVPAADAVTTSTALPSANSGDSAIQSTNAPVTPTEPVATPAAVKGIISKGEQILKNFNPIQPRGSTGDNLQASTTQVNGQTVTDISGNGSLYVTVNPNSAGDHEVYTKNSNGQIIETGVTWEQLDTGGAAASGVTGPSGQQLQPYGTNTYTDSKGNIYNQTNSGAVVGTGLTANLNIPDPRNPNLPIAATGSGIRGIIGNTLRNFNPIQPRGSSAVNPDNNVPHP